MSATTTSYAQSSSLVLVHSPSRLCTSLPAPFKRCVDAFLGFSVLVDLRALSRDMQQRCAAAALRWMRRQLKETQAREAARVHAALLTVGLRCDGDCGWGECDPPEDNVAAAAAKRLVQDQSDDEMIFCSDTDGHQWSAHRANIHSSDDEESECHRTARCVSWMQPAIHVA